MSEAEPTILAVHSGALGDVVLFGRLLGALGGRVTLVAGGGKGGLLAGLGAVERWLDFDALPMHEVFCDTPVDSCALPRLVGRHDRLVSCFAAGQRPAELRLAAMCGSADAAFLPVRPGDGAEAHLLDVWCDMLGIDGVDERPWRVAPGWRDEAAEMLAALGIEAENGYAVIHPGAGAPEKCWPVGNFVALARRIGRCAVFVLGPVEADRWAPETIEQLRQEVSLVVCPPLTALAGMLGGADAFVGNDSGVSHLAAAVGAPTVALFGPTRPEQFRPRGERVIVLAAEPISHISVSEVAANVMAVAGEPAQISASLCRDLAAPLEEIIAEADGLKDDYIGHDELRRRLELIAAHAAGAHEVLSALSSGPVVGVVGRPGRSVEPDPDFEGNRVLVVDDESTVCRTVSDVLGALGCEVDVAADGEQARLLIAEAHYDLVISEIKLSGATGYDVLAAARAASTETPVILMTAFAYDPNHSTVRANREGLAAVLFKPFKVNQLLAECRSALARRTR